MTIGEEVMNEIAKELRKEYCNICNKNAIINVTGETLKFTGCCQTFEENVNDKRKEITEDIISKIMRKRIDDTFKDFGR